MTMEVSVNGTDVDPAELESSGWVTKVSKRVVELQQQQKRARQDGAAKTTTLSGGDGEAGKMASAGYNDNKYGVSGGRSLKAEGRKLAERSVASHLPRLPSTDHKIYYQAQGRTDPHRALGARGWGSIKDGSGHSVAKRSRGRQDRCDTTGRETLIYSTPNADDAKKMLAVEVHKARREGVRGVHLHGGTRKLWRGSSARTRFEAV
ncbi:hypothetical protein HPB48_016417 [Haemaphysalis longicornis]|uniref:Uncharacterized protein n=1 Tax=Haemaphysalis longicornis TaxID=44386 RepID=A0A9J6GYU0_HAELO|nr:hypothetical protein HPB48_016417 [Haemaphysalis longicornis]